MAGYVGGPGAEAAMCVDGANPLSQELPLGLLLLGVLAFNALFPLPSP